MTDYSKLSDFEINKRVCDVFWPDFSKSAECRNKSFPQNTSIVYIDNGYGGLSRDYCNNPADAWPIIVEHHIAVVPYRHTLPQAWPTAFGLRSKFTTEDKNPLRAAMIVFLMMQEKK